MAYREIAAAPELARRRWLSPRLKCLSHPARDQGRRQGPGGRGRRRERASRARKAESAPGAGQGRSPLARSARLASPAAAAASLCGSPSRRGPGRARRTAESPVSCYSAAGRHKRRWRWRGERRDSGLARSPAPRGAKLRPAAAKGLPSSGGSQRRTPGIGARGLPGHTRAGGRPLPRAAPETVGGDPNTPALLRADTRQHPGTQPPAGKHVHANTYTACAAGPGCAPPGIFRKCIYQLF